MWSSFSFEYYDYTSNWNQPLVQLSKGTFQLLVVLIYFTESSSTNYLKQLNSKN